jgi:hypothetical protein
MMKLNLFRKSITSLKSDFSVLIFLKFSPVILILLSAEVALSQDRTLILKINDPAPVCAPATVDLTSKAITSGSTEGLIFSYFNDPELTKNLSDPTKVGDGKYFIKGTSTVSGNAFVAASVRIKVMAKPKLVVANQVIQGSTGKVDLTLPQVTSGSDEGLTFSYWLDALATKLLPDPNNTGKGQYFIKATSLNECFEIQLINVVE